MDENKSWEFKKGNSNEAPLVRQSGKPIEKEKIDETILNFIYEKLPNDSELLKVTDFKIEFLCWGEQIAFIKIDIESGNKKIIDLKLTDADAKKFVDLIRNSVFSDGDINTPINDN